MKASHTFKIKGNHSRPSNLVKPGYAGLSKEEMEWRSYHFNEVDVDFGRMKEVAGTFTRKR